jgi:hypothetical protein
MSNTIPTDEQKQVKQILNRWHKHRNKQYFAYNVIGLVFMFLVSLNFIYWKILPPLLVILGFAVLSLNSFYITWKTQKQFVRQMTDEELILLSRPTTSSLTRYEKLCLGELERMVKKTVPKDEFLRASQKPENDGTLLRVAKHDSEISHEELLRASNTSEYEQHQDEVIRLKMR